MIYDHNKNNDSNDKYDNHVLKPSSNGISILRRA